MLNASIKFTYHKLAKPNIIVCLKKLEILINYSYYFYGKSINKGKYFFLNKPLLNVYINLMLVSSRS